MKKNKIIHNACQLLYVRIYFVMVKCTQFLERNRVYMECVDDFVLLLTYRLVQQTMTSFSEFFKYERCQNAKQKR